MEKHWQDEDWHKFYAEHLNLDPEKFTTNELVRLYDLHHYRQDLCGDNGRAREILDSGIRSPLEAPGSLAGLEGDGHFDGFGYLIEFGKDENGDVFTAESFKGGCLDRFMANPVVTLEFNPAQIVGKVLSFGIDERGVFITYAGKAPAGSDVKKLQGLVPALGGVITGRGGDLAVVQRLDQVGLIRPENRVKRGE